MNEPNIVLFMLDQLSAKWIEAASHGICSLPNIEQLRKTGTSFSNVITSNPVCCSTRSTLATGLTSRGHGVLENGYFLDPELPTFMRAVQDAGWRTGAFGKVHLRPHYAGVFPDFRPYGFDITHITEDARGGEWLEWVKSNHADHYETALATIWAGDLPDFSTHGPLEDDLYDQIQFHRSNFKWATPDFPLNTHDAYALPFPSEVSQTEWITSNAIEFLIRTDASRPLFAQISYVQPHIPFCAPGEDIRSVNVEAIPEPVRAEWIDDPSAPIYYRTKKPTSLEGWRYKRQVYFADLIHLDRQLGRVLGALRDVGREDNTYVIFLSDHGDLLGDHGFYGKEERHYDACIRVPLIMFGPGISAGQTRDEMVQLEDICPTILQLTGQTLPPVSRAGRYLKPLDDRAFELPGRSLLPLCKGQIPGQWRTESYCESYNAIWSDEYGDWARTLRNQRYRYTYYANYGGDQLFDLVSDPDEQLNLAVDPAYADVRLHLRDSLLEAIIRQDYPKTPRNLFAHGVH